MPILSIQPFNQDDYEYAVKIRTMNVQDHDDLQGWLDIRFANTMHVENVLNANQYAGRVQFQYPKMGIILILKSVFTVRCVLQQSIWMVVAQWINI